MQYFVYENQISQEISGLFGYYKQIIIPIENNKT
jgi:hypothetical protein